MVNTSEVKDDRKRAADKILKNKYSARKKAVRKEDSYIDVSLARVYFKKEKARTGIRRPL